MWILVKLSSHVHSEIMQVMCLVEGDFCNVLTDRYQVINTVLIRLRCVDVQLWWKRYAKSNSDVLKPFWLNEIRSHVLSGSIDDSLKIRFLVHIRNDLLSYKRLKHYSLKKQIPLHKHTTVDPFSSLFTDSRFSLSFIFPPLC